MSNDQLIVDINGMLRESWYAPPSPSIYRVNDSLRSTDNKAYDPMIISIGPFHHGKDHLKDMQKQKKRYLKKLVGESSVDRYVNAIRGKEQAARDCYAEQIALGADEFVQMLLLDASFIIQFLSQNEFDSHTSRFGHVTLILRDLMLFENQIPLFVLEELFNLSKNNNNNREKFSDLIWPFLSPSSLPEDMSLKDAHHHLLGLVHHVKSPSFVKTPSSNGDNNLTMENIQSAWELKESGVVFEKVKNDKTRSWLDLDITFKNKTIYFPVLEISDVTESLLKNMIAYEYHLPSKRPRYVTDYAYFLHCLVHSSKDAELLRSKGIISNRLGGDDRVYELIQRLGTNAQPSQEFSYLGVFRSVNKHCKHRRNRWVAVLRRNHFNNPWTIISLVAAALLLSATIVQTVYSILSYHRRYEL